MIKKVLIALVAIIAIFLVVVAMQPSSYHVERSQTMKASPDLVWAYFSDFNQWKKWSHWEKSDPSQTTTITGTPSTVGHKTVWSGEKTGKGEMLITEATKAKSLKIDLAFKEPMASVAKTYFTVVPEGKGVKVTWAMDGKNDFVGKFFGLVMGMEGMIGGAYEDSLKNLKELSEKAQIAAAKKAAELAAAKKAADAAAAKALEEAKAKE